LMTDRSRLPGGPSAAGVVSAATAQDSPRKRRDPGFKIRKAERVSQRLFPGKPTLPGTAPASGEPVGRG
jgi:hypothetical protein